MNENDSLSRLYKDAARPEPSQALDEAILAASRRAALAGPQRRQTTGRSNRWSVPLALAATVVLTVSVTMMVHEERPYGDAALSVPAVAPATPDAIQKVIPAAEPAAQNKQSREPSARPAYQPAQTERRDAPVVTGGTAAPSAPATQKAAAALYSPSPAPSLSLSLSPERERADKTVQPVLQPAPSTQGAADVGTASSAGLILEQKAESSPAPAVAASTLQGLATGSAAPRGLLRDEARISAAPAAVMPAPAPAALERRAFSSSARDETAAGRFSMDEKSPERWIVEIRELKRAGRATEATDRLVEFKKRFPDYKLPDDLK